MATIQGRKSRGHTYWYIVESRRVNGKPRPITLAYLGKASDLLQRLQGQKGFSIRTFSHGDSRALLEVAKELQIVDCINSSVMGADSGSPPIRNGLTVGASLLLAAVGRACHPTSKRGWYQWAKETDLDYLLKIKSKKLTSQHFWDQMDVLPVEEISKIEERIVRNLVTTYGIELDLLLLDYTNFFTFINSGNDRCQIAQRGKNKQRRLDLRQVGLALVVSRKEQLPLFHYTYQGDRPDVSIFKKVLQDIKNRIAALTQVERITLVFDKGNNSKANLSELSRTDIYYVGSLTPAYHKKLLAEANERFSIIEVGDRKVSVYRTTADIWGEVRTVVVYISEHLLKGQIRGIHQLSKQKFKLLEKLKSRLEKNSGRTKKGLSRKQIQAQIEKIIQGQYLKDVITWSLEKKSGKWLLTYGIDQEKLKALSENFLGRRILMTNRHNWTAKEILLAYWSQTKVEYAFKNFKNPFHAAFRPQFHWTDQKLQVHSFICVLAYLMTMVVFLKAKRHAAYRGSVHALMEKLKSIRLATILENKDGKRGRIKVDYRLEEIPTELQPLAEALKINSQNIRPQMNVGVYS